MNQIINFISKHLDTKRVFCEFSLALNSKSMKKQDKVPIFVEFLTIILGNSANFGELREVLSGLSIDKTENMDEN